MIIKKIHSLVLSGILTIFSVSNLFAQSIPERPNPPRLVNDLASMLNSQEIDALERKLVDFSDSTSTQIAIVTVPTLDGTDISDYAQKLAEKWGIGQKGKDNGILILVKPKTSDSKGFVKIAQGYGLEGSLPDITCAEIIDYEILPAFKNGDIYGGLNNATNIIMSLVRGEFTAADYGKKGNGKGIPIGPVLIGIFILISIISKASGGGNNKHIGSGGLPFWLLMGMMGSGRGQGGSWGGFSGGSGGGGGFGGFGGGSFGGGGASGSW